MWDKAGVGARERIAALAESVNETARMARVNGWLTLAVALYLALTLLSATDENLLRNAVVTLPQFETGISLELSYLFAPVVFLYLHVQSLFLLAVLVRKLSTFEQTLEHVFGHNNEALIECRNWLSGIDFVQGLSGIGGIAVGAKILAWTGLIWIPVLLLFLIEVSFLRFQSMGISCVHFICFFLDVIGVCLLLRYIAVHCNGIRNSNSRMLLYRVKVPTFLAPLCLASLVILVGVFAWPKGYHGTHHMQEEAVVRNLEYESLWARVTRFNMFDDMLCGNLPWRGFCRTLDLRGATLVRLQGERGTVDLPEEFELKRVDHYRRTFGLDLAGRSLRFANMEGTYLLVARLADADLRGADLAEAKLRGADLTRARLRGATLSSANLQGADLSGVDLRGAYLSGADLRDTELTKDADLRDAKLNWADLRGSDLSHATLHNVEMENAKLQGVNLRGSELQCAFLNLITYQAHPVSYFGPYSRK